MNHLYTYQKPWNLFSTVHRLYDDWQKETQDDQSMVATSHWQPPVDIVETAEAFIVSADLPGVAPKDIEITMKESILSIKGERRSDKKSSDAQHSRHERTYGSFYRRFSLPETADGEKITAKSADGVLTLTIPKKEQVVAKEITIEIGD